MRNLGTQHCLTSDDDANYRQKNSRKKETNVSLSARRSLRDNISYQVHVL